MASKEKQMAAIEDSRLPERDSVAYETTHNLEIPNLAVTVNFLNYCYDSFSYFSQTLKYFKKIQGIRWTFHSNR